MCHSVRKSFLSALYGVYWDRGELELNKTLADLGLDDAPSPLLESERQARILDLLKARSGIFHPAAYAGRTDSRPRGSEGPGRFFAYNNWDFNTLAHILQQETGADVFEAFDEHFAKPLGMQDYRVRDGYYHFERDKSQYPAYPFRMSARDAARFGLLFTRLGDWGGERVLSRHWVRRSTALYSIDNIHMGYGFMWWVFREPQFEAHGMVAALGVGNQMIAALPDSDLVIVNRANTFDGESTPLDQLRDLIQQVLDARTSSPAADPELVPLEPQVQLSRLDTGTKQELEAFVGSFTSPPAPLDLLADRTFEIRMEGSSLVARIENRGAFDLHRLADGTFLAEDSLVTGYPIYVRPEEAGGGFVCGTGPETEGLAFAGLAQENELRDAALVVAGKGDLDHARTILAMLPMEAHERSLNQCLLDAVTGGIVEATETTLALAAEHGDEDVESEINQAGYQLLRSGHPQTARQLFELNISAFPKSANAWDSLAEAHLALGDEEQALQFYEVSLELDSNNANARRTIERLRGQGDAANK